MNKTPQRRVPKTYTFRLDLLNKFEEMVPLGERSALLDKLLTRELARLSRAAKA
jgi:hypothetical protein